MGPRIGAAFIQQLVMAYVVSMFVFFLNVSDTIGALQLTFWLWLGFLAMPLLNGVLWEKRTVSLYLFNIVYHFVALAAMALILGLWR